MFKNISNIFEKKKKILKELKDKESDVKTALKIFLEKEFGENLKGFSFIINYSSKDNTLQISADNKIIANELVLRLEILNKFLKLRGIKLEKILIR